MKGLEVVAEAQKNVDKIQQNERRLASYKHNNMKENKT